MWCTNTSIWYNKLETRLKLKVFSLERLKTKKLGSEKILCQKKSGPKNVGLKKFWVKMKFWVKEKYWLGPTNKLGPKKNFGPKSFSAFWVQKDFGPKKHWTLQRIWAPKNFGSKKNVGPKNSLVWKQFWSEKKFESKKDFGSEKKICVEVV